MLGKKASMESAAYLSSFVRQFSILEINGPEIDHEPKAVKEEEFQVVRRETDFVDCLQHEVKPS